MWIRDFINRQEADGFFKAFQREMENEITVRQGLLLCVCHSAFAFCVTHLLWPRVFCHACYYNKRPNAKNGDIIRYTIFTLPVV